MSQEFSKSKEMFVYHPSAHSLPQQTGTLTTLLHYYCSSTYRSVTPSCPHSWTRPQPEGGKNIFHTYISCQEYGLGLEDTDFYHSYFGHKSSSTYWRTWPTEQPLNSQTPRVQRECKALTVFHHEDRKHIVPTDLTLSPVLFQYSGTDSPQAGWGLWHPYR